MNWKLGNVSGIPIYVHWSFWLLPLLVLFSGAPGDSSLLLRLVLLFLIFGCVVLHELGHALMARLFNVRTRDITLYPIGGVASLERMPRHPFAESAIALAGPAVNVAIAAALVVVQVIMGGLLGTFGGAVLQTLLYANVVLVLFNMLPVFPMDGGRVLRAVLGWFVSFGQATRIAARIGQGFAVVLGIIGLFGNPMLLFVAMFVFLAAQGELMMVRRQEVLNGLGGDPRRPMGSPFGSSPAGPPQPDTTRANATPGSSSSGTQRPARYALLDKRGRVISTY